MNHLLQSRLALGRIISFLPLCAFLTWPCTAQARGHEAEEGMEATELTYLGYIADSELPRIHVRTGEPSLARLEKLSRDHWALHLPHAQIVRHVMGLPLDTSCFAGALDRIEPEPQEEPQSGTVINIFLRHRASLRMAHHGRDLFVSIATPAGKASHSGQSRRR